MEEIVRARSAKAKRMSIVEREALVDRAVQDCRQGDIYQHSQIWVVVGKKL